MKIDMISESEFTVQGHGVHTAFVEVTNALKAREDADVAINTARKNADIVHTHTIGLYSARKLRQSGGKKVISGHVVPASFIGSLKGAKLAEPFARLYLRRFYNKADLVLAVSDYTKQELKKIGVKKPISVLYNTIDTAKYASSPAAKKSARRKLGIDKDAFVVIGSGQVQPRKRVDVFVAMANKMPDVEFVWVGGIPFGAIAAENGAMQKIMKKPPKNLKFTGVVPLDEMADYYRAADVFVLPSEQETFGLVVVEASAAGLPIVLRDVSDYDTTFRDGAVMAMSDDDFASQVDKLRTNKTFYRDQQKAATRIAKRFDSKAGGERLVEFYRSVLD